jgi:hypothetical protein
MAGLRGHCHSGLRASDGRFRAEYLERCRPPRIDGELARYYYEERSHRAIEQETLITLLTPHGEQPWHRVAA